MITKNLESEMKITQNEMDEVIKLIEHLKYMDDVRFSASLSTPIDYEARLKKGGTDYIIRGVDVQRFIEEQIEKDINETVAKLSECGVTATELII